MMPFQSNPALQAIIERAVKPLLDSRQHDASGTILEYHPETNTADILVNIAGEKVRYNQVALPFQAGVIGKDPAPGDEVWVSFQAGNIGDPKIVMLYDGVGRGLDSKRLRARARIPAFWGV